MPNLTQWLNAEKIQYIERVSDWKAAIQVAGDPLLSEGAISQDYIDTIIRLKQETGPYFVIAPRIAMPHAALPCRMPALSRVPKSWDYP